MSPVLNPVFVCVSAWSLNYSIAPLTRAPFISIVMVWVLRLRFKRRDGIRSGGGGPAFIPNPSQISGDHHPGHIPQLLWMLMQLMLHVMSLEQLYVGQPSMDLHVQDVSASKAFQFHGQFENVDMFAGRRAISKAYVRKNKRATALDILIDNRDDSWLKSSFSTEP